MPRTVLFVCIGNTFRSVLAEELFNARAPSGWLAESAGVSPEPRIAPPVDWLLAEKGITLRKRTPRLVTQQMIARASRVVTFGCLDRCPIGAVAKSEDWPIPGSTDKTNEELRAIRDGLSRKVDDLIARLAGFTS
ncbi:MAG TPA: low molecular weight phosphatase family protein [Nitrososphaerales archaeon]|nr:low molecular weight phosphatase family protein [Nitrososphaerales archaeon]